MQHTPEMNEQILEVAARIHELREITGIAVEEMAQKTGVTLQEYLAVEAGQSDPSFTFIYKCAQLFGVEITDLLSGSSATLSSYTVTRGGNGTVTVMEDGIEIRNLAPYFRNKLAEPHWVRYSVEPEENLHLSTHSGQEFDYIISGSLKVQVGDNVEVLHPGDSIYYNSSTPHGMVAVGDEDCVFCAVVVKGSEEAAAEVAEAIRPVELPDNLIYENFIVPEEDENGAFKNITFKNEDEFNFAYDVVDALARRKPNKLAMLHVDQNKQERYFTFKDISRYSSKAANYFRSLGIKKGDRVMLVLRRHYQFWFAILGLHKLGAIAIPATDQLVEHDFSYRFQAAGVNAIVCTSHGNAAMHAENAAKECPNMRLKIMVDGQREGWHDFDSEFRFYSDEYVRPAFDECPCGEDTMIMFFTSGTTGYPKIAAHNYKYALGHFATAKYWHCVDPEGIHFTISDTGWGKALWGKLYGQWLCEAATFVYDFDRFDAHDILPMFKKYNITTFCAPPTMYRFMIKEDLSKYDLSSIKHATTAGEALNPEVFHQFRKATGLSVMEGFGQTETTLVLGNFAGMTPKIGAMGKPNPVYDVDIVDPDGNSVADGETGEIVIHTDGKIPCGLFQGYYLDDEKTRDAWHDGLYHTGDTAWRDEDGYFWYVGRVDDVIKSSGYRIGPFEIESVIMELPYVLECGVSAAPDEIRGQVVKASIVLTKGTEGTDELKKEIQKYVKEKTAPYKYPRIVVFRDELPKTISGKIQRNKL
ncbi:MAG: AMP-binding protein [Candidatus Heteroscillospira sp.]|jgi:acetyl-CoA synthetase